MRDGNSYVTSYSNFDAYGNAQTVQESSSGGGNIGAFSLFGSNLIDTGAVLTSTSNVSTMAAYGRTTLYTFAPKTDLWMLRLVSRENLEGWITDRQYNAQGNLSYLARYGVGTSYEYDVQGNLFKTTDSLNRSTYYENYYRGIPRRETFADGSVITRDVSSAGNITLEVDQRGFATGYGYDALNRITLIDHPRDADVVIQWEGNKVTYTQGGASYVSLLDGFANEISHIKTDPISPLQNSTVNLSRDALGRVTFVSYPNSSQGTSTSLDMLNRPLVISHPDGSNRQYRYGGENVSIQNERGIATTYTYRAYGDPDQRDLVFVTAPAGASMVVSYNAIGQVTGIGQGGLWRTYTYNANGYLTNSTDPEVGSTAYGRDLLGNLTYTITNGSQPTFYGYDALNRQVQITPPTAAEVISKGYYADGKLRLVNTPNTSRYFEYDANDNLTFERLSIDGSSYDFNYSYSANGGLSLMRYPSGQLIDYGPNAFGRPTRAAPFASDVDFYPIGQLRTMKYANGMITSIGLNIRHLPQRLITEMVGSRIVDLSYTYSGNENITSIIDGVDSTNSIPNLIYDDIDQLIAADGSTQLRRFSYDGMGNIATRVENDKTLTYNYANNKLLFVTGASKPYSLQYDVYGNVVHNGSKSFLYNALGQMVCSACGQSNEARHTYDGLGMRVKTTSNGTNTYFVYGQSGQMLLEVTPFTADNKYHQKEYYYLANRQIAFKTSLKDYPNISIENTAVQFYDGSVTLIARVGNPSLTGQITFKQKLANGTVLVLGSADIINGYASLTTRLPLETVQIIVSYAGNADFVGYDNLFNITVKDISWLPAILDLLNDDS